MNEIDWKNLSFGYMKTDYNVRIYYRDGKWGEIETCSESFAHGSYLSTLWTRVFRGLEGLSLQGWKDSYLPC